MSDNIDDASIGAAAEDRPAEQTNAYVASQWQLMWWRFRRHKVAVVSAVVLAFIYLVAFLAGFVAPFSATRRLAWYAYAPPQRLHLIDRAEDGGARICLHVHDFQREVKGSRRYFTPDPAAKIPLRFFGRGEPYKLFGLISTDIHLLVPQEPDKPMFLLGADHMGRDFLSRLIHGALVSMSIGLVGVFLSLFLGVLLGGISGYYGGTWDMIIQRLIEFLHTVPSIPLWMGLSAAIPLEWPVVARYFAITAILSLIGWTGLARVVRGRFLVLREEDFVMAARLYGTPELRIILRHMVPSFLSYLIASLTLSIPSMILSETALSFLGLGMQPPAVSWGVLLQAAQNVRTIAWAPWLLLAGVPVVIVVLAFNFLGDGLRDAADPYG